MSLLQRCVVGVDGSEGSAVAFEWAVARAGATGPDGEVMAVHAFSPGAELFAAAAQVNLDPVRAEHERLLHNDWIAAAEGTGVEVRMKIVDDVPAAALMRSSGQHGNAPIVIGHQPHGRWGAHHVGHVAGQLLHHADVPVIIVNAATSVAPLGGTVVVAVHEPVDVSHQPIVWAATLARERELALHVLSVASPPTASRGDSYSRAAYKADTEDAQKANRTMTTALADSLIQAYPTVTVTSEALFGHPIDLLAIAVSDVDAGVVVIGSHHPSAFASFLTDGVARRLPTLVTCPVVSVPVA